MYRDRVERAEQRNMDFYAKEVERIDHPRRTSLEPSVVPEPPTEETKGEDHSAHVMSGNHLLRLFDTMSLSMFSCSHFSPT